MGKGSQQSRRRGTRTQRAKGLWRSRPKGRKPPQLNQDVTVAPPPPTPEQTIAAGTQALSLEILELRGKLAATQDELTRVLNVGLTSGHLATFAERIERTVRSLHGCVPMLTRVEETLTKVGDALVTIERLLPRGRD